MCACRVQSKTLAAVRHNTRQRRREGGEREREKEGGREREGDRKGGERGQVRLMLTPARGTVFIFLRGSDSAEPSQPALREW